MIDITKLKEKDVGRWVEWQGYIKERGKLKSWNDKYIFIVYKCGSNWNNFQNYTGIATNPEFLIFI